MGCVWKSIANSEGHDEVIYKDALEIECRRSHFPFTRERKHEVEYRGVILPHFYYADFIMFDKILFEGKACAALGDAHVKQVLNYLAASKLQLGLLVNIGEDSLMWRRIIRSEVKTIAVGLKNYPRQSA